MNIAVPRLAAASVLLGSLALGVACARDTGPPPATIGGDFTLIDQDSTAFNLAALRGKVVLVFFGYSQCPDVCPTTLSKLSSVARRLGDQRTGMKVVYVSVDPERDTPAVLKADLQHFDLDAVGVTGTRAEIDRVVRMYGAKYEIVPTPESAARYTVSHSTTLYVLDKQGKVVEQFPYEATAGEIADAVRSLLAR